MHKELYEIVSGATKFSDESSNNNDFVYKEVVKYVDELRFRRKQDAENETKIKILFDEKHCLENKLDEEIKSKIEFTENAERDLKRLRVKHDNDVEDLQKEQIKNKLTIDNMKLEMKLLKDQLKKLQLEKLGFEKQIRSKESCNSLHVDLQNDIMERFSKCKKMQDKTMISCQQYLKEISDIKEIISQAMQQLEKMNTLLKQQKEIMVWIERDRKDLINDNISLKSDIKGHNCSKIADDGQFNKFKFELRDKSNCIEKLKEELKDRISENGKSLHALKTMSVQFKKQVELYTDLKKEHNLLDDRLKEALNAVQDQIQITDNVKKHDEETQTTLIEFKSNCFSVDLLKKEKQEYPMVEINSSYKNIGNNLANFVLEIEDEEENVIKAFSVDSKNEKQISTMRVIDLTEDFDEPGIEVEHEDEIFTPVEIDKSQGKDFSNELAKKENGKNITHKQKNSKDIDEENMTDLLPTKIVATNNKLGREVAGPSPREVALPSPREVALPSPREVALPSPREVAGPSPREVAGPSPREVAGPSPREVAGPSPREVAGPSPREVAGPSPREVAGPSPREVAGPSPREVAGPSPREVAGPSPREVAGPSPREVAGPSPREVAGPSPREVALPSPGKMTGPGSNDVETVDISKPLNISDNKGSLEGNSDIVLTEDFPKSLKNVETSEVKECYRVLYDKNEVEDKSDSFFVADQKNDLENFKSNFCLPKKNITLEKENNILTLRQNLEASGSSSTLTNVDSVVATTEYGFIVENHGNIISGIKETAFKVTKQPNVNIATVVLKSSFEKEETLNCSNIVNELLKHESPSCKKSPNPELPKPKIKNLNSPTGSRQPPGRFLFPISFGRNVPRKLPDLSSPSTSSSVGHQTTGDFGILKENHNIPKDKLNIPTISGEIFKISSANQTILTSPTIKRRTATNNLNSSIFSSFLTMSGENYNKSSTNQTKLNSPAIKQSTASNNLSGLIFSRNPTMSEETINKSSTNQTILTSPTIKGNNVANHLSRPIFPRYPTLSGATLKKSSTNPTSSSPNSSRFPEFSDADGNPRFPLFGHRRALFTSPMNNRRRLNAQEISEVSPKISKLDKNIP